MTHSLHSISIQFSATYPQQNNYHVVFIFAGVVLMVAKFIN
jgi:hypothetical protein